MGIKYLLAELLLLVSDIACDGVGAVPMRKTVASVSLLAEGWRGM